MRQLLLQLEKPIGNSCYSTRQPNSIGPSAHRTTPRSAPSSLFNISPPPSGNSAAHGTLYRPREGVSQIGINGYPQPFQIFERPAPTGHGLRSRARERERFVHLPASCGDAWEMEWSHTHFDGYELLAVPSDSPASIVLLDSSALVLVQRVLLPQGDAPPRALTWQPGGASTGCSSGALACIVSTRGKSRFCSSRLRR